MACAIGFFHHCLPSNSPHAAYHLSLLQKGEPFNYFIYPYAELEGKPFSGLQSHFLFRVLAPAVTTAAAGAAASR